ncbi:MAG: hypothetical protein QM802_17980 [Agriterribacter sp.]
MEIVNTNDHYFFKRTYFSLVSFCIAVLLFLLPYAEVKCGSAIIKNSGLGIATGSPWTMSDDNQNEILNKVNDVKPGKELLQYNPNIFALAVLAAGLFGVIIYFTNVNWRSMAAMCAGIIGALMFIAMMVQLRIQIGGLIGRIENVQKGISTVAETEIRFTTWYYFSLIAFIGSAFFNYMYDRIVLKEAIEQSMDFEFQQTYI